jgi:hypothetical protein
MQTDVGDLVVDCQWSLSMPAGLRLRGRLVKIATSTQKCCCIHFHSTLRFGPAHFATSASTPGPRRHGRHRRVSKNLFAPVASSCPFFPQATPWRGAAPLNSGIARSEGLIPRLGIFDIFAVSSIILAAPLGRRRFRGGSTLRQANRMGL